MKTRMTELLKIKYPIMHGGMQWIGLPELAAAVSNAGGLGTINITCFSSPDEFRQAVRKMKELTSAPFCVNISLSPRVSDGKDILKYIYICADEQVPVIETSGASPAVYIDPIKNAGITLIHKVATVKNAVSAEKLGADMVSVVGIEA